MTGYAGVQRCPWRTVMTQFLIRLFIRQPDRAQEPKVRAAYGNLACWVGMACPILNRLTMPQTGGWSVIRWNASPPLILCIKGRTFLSPVLQERGKAIWLVPLATRHVKEDSALFMPMLQNCLAH